MADQAASPRRLAGIPAFLLVVVALWEIVATRCQATDVPGDDAWREAAAVVRATYQKGDLIVFAPRWIDPVGRLFLGDLIPVETAARMDADTYGRIWELSIRGAVAPEVSALTAVQTHAGAVEVRRYEQKPAEVVSDLMSYAAGARIDLVEVGFEPHRCVVLAVPASRPYLKPVLEALDRLPDATRAKTVRALGATLRELPAAYAVPKDDRDGKWLAVQMPLGGTLVGAFGIADVFTRRDERRAIELHVEVDGATALETTAPIDRWVRFQAATSPGRHAVRFRLRWEANPGELTGNKAVCLNAEGRK